MNKLFFKRASLFFLAAFALLQSCKKDKATVITPVVIPDQSFTQSFESLSAAQTQGWIFKYQSNDPNFTYPWRVTTGGAIAPIDGTHDLYSFNDYLGNGNSDDADSTISNWAISPVIWFQNGDSISFYTYSEGQTAPIPIIGGRVPDRLQLRMTRFDSTSNTGTTSSDVGSFINPLIDINPLLKGSSGAYPATWTRYSAVISGLNAPFQGRFAIRYFVPDFWDYGWGVHIDKVSYKTVSH